MIGSAASDTVRSLVQRFLARHGPLRNAIDINRGHCGQFAKELAALLPDAKAVWSYNLPGGQFTGISPMATHCMVYSAGRWYDSETPDGVEQWHDLPTFC